MQLFKRLGWVALLAAFLVAVLARGGLESLSTTIWDVELKEKAIACASFFASPPQNATLVGAVFCYEEGRREIKVSWSVPFKDGAKPLEVYLDLDLRVKGYRRGWLSGGEETISFDDARHKAEGWLRNFTSGVEDVKLVFSSLSEGCWIFMWQQFHRGFYYDKEYFVVKLDAATGELVELRDNLGIIREGVVPEHPIAEDVAKKKAVEFVKKQFAGCEIKGVEAEPKIEYFGGTAGFRAVWKVYVDFVVGNAVKEHVVWVDPQDGEVLQSRLT